MNLGKYGVDWITALVLAGYFFLVAENSKPFNRQFSLNDLMISHPFAYHERVSGIKCIVLAFVIPCLTFFGVTMAKQKRFNLDPKQLKLLEVSMLALCLSLTIDGVVTDTLKNWIGRPRPDFLERCGPKKGTPLNKLVDVSVCTAPLGQSLLIDGMRSTPSGHASISFSTFTLLTLWLYKQLQVSRNQKILKVLVASLPLLLASYIALSRVQDYRHHFTDIILGTIIGNAFAVAVFFKYFPDEEEQILPV